MYSKITTSKKENDFILKILCKLPEKWMEYTILFWSIMWTLLGIIVFYYFLFGGLNADQKMFFTVYLVFWMYFEFLSLKSYFLKTKGYELIRIKEDFLYYKRAIWKYGKVEKYDINNISEIKLIKQKKQSFNYAYNQSYWVIGNEKIEFFHLNKKVKIGMHLSEKESKKVLKIMIEAIHQAKKNAEKN